MTLTQHFKLQEPTHCTTRTPQCRRDSPLCRRGSGRHPQSCSTRKSVQVQGALGRAIGPPQTGEGSWTMDGGLGGPPALVRPWPVRPIYLFPRISRARKREDAGWCFGSTDKFHDTLSLEWSILDLDCNQLACNQVAQLQVRTLFGEAHWLLHVPWRMPEVMWWQVGSQAMHG